MKFIFPIIILILILAGAAYYFLVIQSQPKPESETLMAMTESTPVPSSESDSNMEKTYPLDEVAKHDSADDCWLAIEGKVYDITEFIGNHPGGEAILQGCGTNATILYNNRPNGSGAHSEKARGLLPNYEIGSLSE